MEDGDRPAGSLPGEAPGKAESSGRDRLLQRAVRVLGDAARAGRWLRQPNPDLRGRAPLELLDSDFGRREVEQLLARMERGTYA